MTVRIFGELGRKLSRFGGLVPCGFDAGRGAAGLAGAGRADREGAGLEDEGLEDDAGRAGPWLLD